MRISDWSSDVCSSDLTIPAHRPQDHITLEMAPLEIRHRSVRPISAKHAQASRFLQQSRQARPWCLQPGIRGEVRLVERAFGIGPSALTEAMGMLNHHFADAA